MVRKPSAALSTICTELKRSLQYRVIRDVSGGIPPLARASYGSVWAVENILVYLM